MILHPNTEPLHPPWPWSPLEVLLVPYRNRPVIPHIQLLLPIMNGQEPRERELCCPLPSTSPRASPMMTLSITVTLRSWALGPARRGEILPTARWALSQLRQVANHISLLGSPKNKTGKPARTLGDCGLIFYGVKPSGTEGDAGLAGWGCRQEFWAHRLSLPIDVGTGVPAYPVRGHSLSGQVCIRVMARKWGLRPQTCFWSLAAKNQLSGHRWGKNRACSQVSIPGL